MKICLPYNKNGGGGDDEKCTRVREASASVLDRKDDFLAEQEVLVANSD